MSRTNHRQRIQDTIRSRILRGAIGPDDRLIDTAIATEMGVSRMPVREALMQLVSEGYLEGTTRGFVLMKLTPERTLEVFLLRRLLEPRAAASAAQAMSVEGLANLRQAAAESAAADNMLTGALKSVFALSEAYPDLKANQNFLALQEELTGTEDKIAYSRQFYNDTVNRYNTKIQSMPSNIIAGMFHFTEREYFEAGGSARGPVSVSF